MKIWVYTIIKGNRHGDEAHNFGTDEEREKWFDEWVTEQWVEDFELEETRPTDPYDAFEALREHGFSEVMEWESTLIEVPTPAEFMELKACAGQLLEQVYQMKGMFSDSDNAIQNAIDETEEAIAACNQET